MRSGLWVPSLLGATFFMAPSVARAERYVEGSIASETWTVGQSPYFLTGNLTIPEGVTLTIMPGVQVLIPTVDGGVGGNTSIQVKGALVAVGTAAAPIDFQREDGPLANGWYGVSVTGSATLAHVHIRDAQMGIAVYGVADVKSSWFEGNFTQAYVRGTSTFDGVKFSGKSSVCVMMQGGVATITNSIFTGASLDGIAREVGQVTVRNCTFNANGTSIYGYQEGMISVSNTIFANNVRAAFDKGFGEMTLLHLVNSLVSGRTTYGSGLVEEDGGVLHGDPGFVGPDDLHLAAGSPCIDTGAAQGAPDHDFDGTPRPVGRGVDIGAFEFDPQREAGAPVSDASNDSADAPVSDASNDSADANTDARSGENGIADAARSPIDVDPIAMLDAEFAASGMVDADAKARAPADASTASIDPVVDASTSVPGQERDSSVATTLSADAVGAPASSGGCGCRVMAGEPRARGDGSSAPTSPIAMLFAAALTASAASRRRAHRHRLARSRADARSRAE